MYSLYSVIFLLLWVGEGLDEGTFQTACDIHSPRRNKSADVLHSQSTILPQKASSDWLFESQPAIKQWYEKGKRECNSYLATSSASFGSKFPDPYRTDGPPGGQNKCRGTDMLYSLTGTLVWPFGPKNCSTYRKCWFGLLTCGEAKSKALQELGKEYILKVLHINQPEKSLPVMDHWSIRALKIHLRVIGLEIIVPQQRFFSISPQDDVIIAQYTVTLPYDSYKLEMRQEELYPSALYQWDTQQIDLYGMEIPGNIYLGGSESRNRPQTTVKITNNCCGCDEKSFVVGTPITMKVSNGIEACPNVLEMRRMFDGDPGHNIINSSFIDNNDSERSKKGKSLPLCKARSSSEPGRWILSSPTRQQSNLHTIACNTLSTAFNDVPKIQKPLIKHGRILGNIDSINEPKKNNSSTYNKWFEASGDPCIVRNVDNEDMKEGSWFFAPYKCKYHFYTKPELNRCLALKNISHIHFHGDSMSRDIFLYVARYLGVSTLTEDGLKHMTNNMKQKKIKVYSGKVLMSEGAIFTISHCQRYTWGYERETMDLITQVPLPQVVVTNYAFAHTTDSLFKYKKKFENTEKSFFKELIDNSTKYHQPIPQYLYFQNAKNLYGKRNLHQQWAAHSFRRSSDILRRGFTELGFAELDEYTLTEGRIDSYDNKGDGWHFFGSMKQMEAVIFFNMICND